MAEIKQAKFIDQTGQEKDAVFIGAEKAIFDDNGERLDHKMEERKKATGLVATDTSGIAGEAGLEVSLQVLIDSVAEKVVNELVTNSALTQTLANYMTKAMMSNVQINDQNKVPTSALAFAMNHAITQLNSETDFWEFEINQDLNSSIQHRLYRTAQSAILASLKNKPSEFTSGEAILIWLPAIKNNSYGFQVFFHSLGKNSTIYFRNNGSSAGWSNWHTL